MSSIWDRLFESPIPIDRLSRIVTSSAPWWAQPIENKNTDPSPDEKSRSSRQISDYVSIMNPPPEGLLDYRGRRSRFNIICGFAHRHQSRRTPSMASSSMTRLVDKFGLQKARVIRLEKTVPDNYSVWYCLRADGQVIIVTSKKLRQKLKNLDDSYLGDVAKGFTHESMSTEWKAISELPIEITPAANNRISLKTRHVNL